MAQSSSVVSSSESSSESLSESEVFFSLIKMPESPSQWQHPEPLAPSQKETRETEKAKEDAEIRLQEALLSLNTVEPWDCIKAHKTWAERTGNIERQDGVSNYMKFAFEDHGMNPQECESYVTARAQDWKKTSNDHIESLGTSIGMAHQFPEAVANDLGRHMIGEVATRQDRTSLYQWCSQAGLYGKQAGLRESIKKSSLAPKNEEFFSYVETSLIEALTVLKWET